MLQDILIDANVILEVFLRRKHFDDSVATLSRLEKDENLAPWIAPHSLATIYYLFRRQVGDEEARQDLRELLSWMQVCPLTTGFCQNAFDYPMSDFEDALQAAWGQMISAKQIVTWNLKDFKDAPVPSVTPSEFLQGIEESIGR